jgi:hypothetical protein
VFPEPADDLPGREQRLINLKCFQPARMRLVEGHVEAIEAHLPGKGAQLDLSRVRVDTSSVPAVGQAGGVLLTGTVAVRLDAALSAVLAMAQAAGDPRPRQVRARCPPLFRNAGSPGSLIARRAFAAAQLSRASGTRLLPPGIPASRAW